jgi:hypothetical protein
VCPTQAQAPPPRAAGQDCPPLATPVGNPPSWDADTAYELTDTKLPDDSLRLTVVGDVLVLDQARFGSLLRSPGLAPPARGAVVLDAREIEVRGPLSLQRGSLRIYAQTLKLADAGLLALSQAAGSSDGIEVYVQRLDLSRAQPVPLQLVVSENPPTGGPVQILRQFKLRAQEVVTPGGVLAGDEAREYLWRASSNFDGLTRRMPYSWNVAVGASGYNEALAEMKRVVAWPDYTAFKLRKHFAFAPFEPGRRQELMDRISRLRPVLLALDRSVALTNASAVALLIQQNLDDRGLGPTHVPSADFKWLQGEVQRGLQLAEPQFDRLRDQVLAAYSLPKLDENAVSRLRKARQDVADNQAQLRLEIEELSSRTGTLESEMDLAKTRIREETKRSEEAFKQEQEKRSRTGESVQWVTKGVAVGASLLATPAVGALIATGVSAAGNAAYAHNTGASTGSQSVLSLLAQNAEVYDTFKKTRESWQNYELHREAAEEVYADKPRVVRDGKVVAPGDKEAPLTKAQAFAAAADAQSQYLGQLGKLDDQLGNVPRPSVVSLPAAEAGNPELLSAITQLAAAQTKHAAAKAEWDKKTSSYAEGQRGLDQMRTSEQVMLELRPANDQEILRWKTAALQMWNLELDKLYGQLRSLRRALYFETFKTPMLPAAVASHPEETMAYMASGRYDPRVGGGMSPLELTKAHLDAEAKRHLSVIQAQLSAIDKAWNAYMDERGSAVEPHLDAQVFSGQPGASEVTRGFLEQLNAQIRSQIEHPSTFGGARFRLLVPIVMTLPKELDRPERLLKVGVAEVRLKDPSVMERKRLYFDTTFRLAGELLHGESCSYVELAVPGGATLASSQRDDAADPRTVFDLREQARVSMSYEELKKSRAPAPARTLYFVSVLVSGDPADAKWKIVPVVESLTFWRRIVQ